MRLDARTQSVMEHFADEEAHLAPSQIDAIMGLAPGTAHDLICEAWNRDKERHEELQRRGKR